MLSIRKYENRLYTGVSHISNRVLNIKIRRKMSKGVEKQFT